MSKKSRDSGLKKGLSQLNWDVRPSCVPPLQRTNLIHKLAVIRFDTGFGLNIEFTQRMIFVTTDSYSTFTDMHAVQITSVHSKFPLSAMSSLVVTKQWLPTMATPLAVCMLTVDSYT
jgi:hypothetical protein